MKPDEEPKMGRIVQRFFLLGFLNTAMSYVLFIGLSFVMHPAFAYTVALLAVLTVVNFASNPWVFRGQDSWTRRFSYIVCYLIIFVLAQATIALTKPVQLLDLILTSGVILSFSIPLTIACGRRAFKPRHPARREAMD